MYPESKQKQGSQYNHKTKFSDIIPWSISAFYKAAEMIKCHIEYFFFNQWNKYWKIYMLYLKNFSPAFHNSDEMYDVNMP